jgi:hypothetical protein
MFDGHSRPSTVLSRDYGFKPVGGGFPISEVDLTFGGPLLLSSSEVDTIIAHSLAPTVVRPIRVVDQSSERIGRTGCVSP